MQKIYLCKSNNPNKKYMVKIENTLSNGKTTSKTIHFGANGMSDYTKHKDPERKQRYIIRHKKRENWNKSGLKTAGFWSYWLLWREKTIREAIRGVEKKFNVKIIRCNLIK